MSTDSKPYRLPTSVLVYCFRLSSAGVEYLMLRRTSKYGGFWQGVTGALEGEETLIDGAKRELKEETGLLPRDLYQVAFNYSFPMEDEWRRAYHPDVESINEYVFLAKMEMDAFPTLSFEHDFFEWAGFDRAISLLKWPNNIEALNFCDQLICGKNGKAGSVLQPNCNRPN